MTIIVAGSDTPAGHAALAYAVEEARRRQVDLVVFPVDGSTVDISTLGYEPVRVEEPAERSQDAVGDLIDAVERMTPQAVVVGVRQRSPVGKFFLGSAAQQIILEANAPVITVKPAR